MRKINNIWQFLGHFVDVFFEHLHKHKLQARFIIVALASVIILMVTAIGSIIVYEAYDYYMTWKY